MRHAFSFRKLLRGMGLLPAAGIRTKINYVNKVKINDVDILIPTIHGMTCDASEPWMIALLAKLLQLRSEAFLDVGVNTGQTLAKLKALDPRREYVGFEPNPACVYYVQNLIKVNHFKSCTLLPAGLFTHDGILSLDLFSDIAADSSASLISSFRPDNKVHSSMFVPVFEFNSLKNILGEKRFGIVKIDVEGAELEVVKSLHALIERDRPVVLIEILPVYSENNTARLNRQIELEEVFADLGYSFVRVEKTDSDEYSGLEPIQNLGIHSDLSKCDYLVIPSEQRSTVTNVG